MSIISDLLAHLPSGKVHEVRIGLLWTAVVAQVEGGLRCGLASTLSFAHEHEAEPLVPQAGTLQDMEAHALAQWALSEKPILASVGMAAINALLPPLPHLWFEANAEDLIAALGAGRRVVLVGHFPFVERLRGRVGELLVLEQTPRPGDLAAELAPQVVPTAEVLVITAMTLANHTLEGLLALRSPGARVLLLGPSTPLSPRLFAHGVDVLCGAAVTDIEAVLRAISQGANFRQVHRAGVRLVNLSNPSLDLSTLA